MIGRSLEVDQVQEFDAKHGRWIRQVQKRKIKAISLQVNNNEAENWECQIGVVSKAVPGLYIQ